MEIITDFVAPAAPNRFNADVKSLIEATDKNPAVVGAFDFSFDASKVDKEGNTVAPKDQVQKDVRAVQAAAGDLDRTARVIKEASYVQSDESTLRVVFKIVAKVPFRKEDETEAAPETAKASK